MLTDMTWLTKTFPPEPDRIREYEENSHLYEGDHHMVWRDLWDSHDLNGLDTTLSTFFGTVYGARKLEYNWFLVVCNVFSDFLAGEPIRLIGKSEQEQTTLDGIRDRSNLDVVIHRLSTDLIRFGDAVFKVRFRGAGHAIPGSVIERVDPSIWFPVVNPDNKDEYIAHVLAWRFSAVVGQSPANLMKAEIHTAGRIEHRLYWMGGDKIDHQIPLQMVERYANYPDVEETNVPYPLVFVASNPKKRFDVYGISDYKHMKSLVKELELRAIKIASILDIHTRPAVCGPESMISTDMSTGDETLRMNGRFFPVGRDGVRPFYMEWDGKLDSSFKEMDEITDMLYKVTDLSPAAMGHFPGGQAVSGSAWRRMLIRTIARVNRMRLAFNVPMRDAIRAASMLDARGMIIGAVEVSLRDIGWQDGLPRDLLEDVKIEQTRKNSGLTSKRHAIMRIDACTEAEADAELALMESEIPDAPREQSPFTNRQPRADLNPEGDRPEPRKVQ